MMRARPGWIVAMSSSVIVFLPLEKLMARIFSSSSLSSIGMILLREIGGSPDIDGDGVCDAVADA
jgi:hypothetical protein